MSVINEQTRGAWQSLADHASLQRPTRGRRVVVTRGRKHKGKQGTVSRHAADKFTDAFRYGSEASHHLTTMQGRYGFAVMIQPDDGTPRFWTKAHQVCCLDEEGLPCLTELERSILADVCANPGTIRDPILDTDGDPSPKVAVDVLTDTGLVERRNETLHPTSIGTTLHER